MEPWAIALTVLASCVLGPAAVLVGGGLLLRRAGLSHPLGTPVAAAPAPTPMSDGELAELRGELAAVRAEWRAHQKQLDAYLDAFQDLEESVERKRRRAASARSRVEAVEQQPAEPENPREAARLRARAQGFRV